MQNLYNCKRNSKLILKINYVMIATLLLFNMCGIMVFADAKGVAFDAIFRAVTIITTTIGAIFLIVGIVKFVIAHANEDGPNQQKAAMMIATGIALAIIGPLMNGFGIENIPQEGDGTTTNGPSTAGGEDETDYYRDNTGGEPLTDDDFF